MPYATTEPPCPGVGAHAPVTICRLANVPPFTSTRNLTPARKVGIVSLPNGAILRAEYHLGELAMSRVVTCVLAVLAFLAAAPSRADAAVTVTIDKSTQRMTVEVDGQTRHTFLVSTGLGRTGTPNGTYGPQRMHRKWFSRKYYNSPMPYSIFFHKGYAIHGTTYISRLGGPASHGCVRLHPSNAAALFALVQEQGAGNTRIVVTGANPTRSARAGSDVTSRAKAKAAGGKAHRAFKTAGQPATRYATSGAGRWPSPAPANDLARYRHENRT